MPPPHLALTTEHRARSGASFRLLWASHPTEATRRRVALILPGANCSAERYLWLGSSLAAAGLCAAVVEPPIGRRESLLEPRTWVEGRFIGVDVVLAAVDRVDTFNFEEVVLIGHSLGGVVALQTIMPVEAMRDPNSGVSAAYPVPPRIRRVIAGGATLEPAILGTTIPWRTAGTPFRPPADVLISLMAGGADALIPLSAVRATAERFAPPAVFAVLPGVTHFGWTTGREGTDRVDLDGRSALSRQDEQRVIAAAIRSRLGGDGGEHHGS